MGDRKRRLSRAIDALALRVEHGALLAATDPAALLESAGDRIASLESRLAEVERERDAALARLARAETALRHIADGGVARDYGLGCGDSACIQRPPSGMATNGGCRCDERSLRRHVHGVRSYARRIENGEEGETK